jgi:DNA mismatch repair ATPase MutS
LINQSLKEQYTTEYKQLDQKYNLFSLFRLALALVFIASIYYYFKTYQLALLVVVAVSFALFSWLMRIHLKVAQAKELKKALIDINQNELTYLQQQGIPFKDGNEHNANNTQHAYSFDLDIFGKNALYHHLNRTATYIGSQTLANLLLSLLSNNHIKNNQAAIHELAEKINWRQDLHALATLSNDNKQAYDALITWANSPTQQTSTWVKVVSYAMPLLFVGMLVLSVILQDALFAKLAFGVFLANLGVFRSQAHNLNNEAVDASNIHQIITQYSLMIEKIEQTTFTSDKLNQLKAQLQATTGKASKQIKRVAQLFSGMETMQNGLVLLLANGTCLYHLHNLSALLQWKQTHAKQIPAWLDVIGQFEALCSLGNFAYNNPQFTYPLLNQNFELDFTNLGHPLIDQQKRVCNDVDFNTQRFIILTGSNMAGKSTFLRTLGINMVLSGIGAPVCASAANVHPLPIIVSMRLSDSLSENESYFFAEVKRLHQIMQQLDTQVCFVLLDEILRGTNSDDKRSGTIAFVKKIISKKAIGAIATHDLEVCQTTTEYPNVLVNKCFEVDIINNDLVFDYKLRNGICKNKSATFLMKKMGII